MRITGYLKDLMEERPEGSAPAPSRRTLLRGGAVAAGLIGLPSCVTAQTNTKVALQSARYDFEDPVTNVKAMARLAGDLAAGKQGHVHYSGRAFAVIPGEKIRPIYGIEGMGSTRIESIDAGAQRFLFSEFAIYTDLESGMPLNQWKNPATGEVLDVWHQRNGPVNFTLKPNMNAFGAFDAVDDAPAFRLPWVVEDGIASFALDVVSSRKNPLDPAKWPNESSGAVMNLSEHSQYFVDVDALVDENVTNLPFHAALQSQKPWHPWMMMGQRPGYVFTRMVARKVSGLEELPDSVAAYARANLEEFINAPAKWTGAYNAAHTIYAKTMTPRSAK